MDQRFILVTLLVQLGVAAAISSALVRSREFHSRLFKEEGRSRRDATILALALMVPRAIAAAERLAAHDRIECEVIDVRSLVPLDMQTILGSVSRTHQIGRAHV